MKRAIVLLGIMLLCAVSSVSAQPMVLCDGIAGGGTGDCGGAPGGLRDYVYHVAFDGAPLRCTVYVGTEDPVASNYTNWCLPAGWSWSLLPTSALDPGYGMLWDDYNSFTPHGTVSPGAIGQCPYVIMAEGPLSPTLTVGFDHPNYPHDVSWLYTTGLSGLRSDWLSPVGTGLGPVHGPSGSGSDCHIPPQTQVLTVVLAGKKDNFATADGIEPAYPSDALRPIVTNCSAGPLTCHPLDADCEFDCATTDRCFGHTFTGNWTLSGTVISAQLCFKIKAGNGSTNDNFSFREEGVGVWGMLISELRNHCVSDPTWPPGAVLECCLDLDNLPIDGRGITNVLGLLLDGDLDVYISDDTQIDYLELSVWTCCDQCIAMGDINGDGIVLAVSDMIYLMDFVNNGGPAPQPLCQGDMNDDGYIDQGDIDIYQNYFIYGMSVFPQYPVITVCEPDTVRGCCCSATQRAVRSAANCAAIGGVYLGDGVLCIDVNPPIITAVSPTPGATGVPKTTDISITFDMNMDDGSIVSNTSITGSQSGGSHLFMMNYDPLTWTATFIFPLHDFIPGEQVEVLLTTGVQSLAGAPLCRNYSWKFTIGSKKGSGTFGPPIKTYIGPDRYPADIAAADMNDDNNPDIVILICDNACNVDSVCTWTNNGSGGGTISGIHPVGFQGGSTGKPASLCGVADFNKDGRNDVAAVKSLEDEDYASILMGVGTKGGDIALAPMGVYPTGFKGSTTGKPASIIADADQDGDQEIIIGNHTDQGDVRVAVIWNIALPDLWISEVYTIPFSGTPIGGPSICEAEANGDDGKWSMVVVQAFADGDYLASFEVMPGASGAKTATLAPMGVYPTGFKGSTTGKPASIVQDMDGDTLPDVIIVDGFKDADSVVHDSVCIMKNLGGGVYSSIAVYPVAFNGAPAGSPSLTGGDFQGDGPMDCVIADKFPLTGDSALMFTGNGSGGCSFDGVYPTGFKGSTTGKPASLVAAELDENAALKDATASGGLDLIYVNFDVCSLAVLFNQPLGCICPCKYDPECDGVISDVLDVTRTINVAFRGQPTVQDPGCPRERSDVDASGATDVLDVTKVINVAFRGQSAATNFVDPCAP